MAAVVAPVLGGLLILVGICAIFIARRRRLKQRSQQAPSNCGKGAASRFSTSSDGSSHGAGKGAGGEGGGSSGGAGTRSLLPTIVTDACFGYKDGALGKPSSSSMSESLQSVAAVAGACEGDAAQRRSSKQPPSRTNSGLSSGSRGRSCPGEEIALVSEAPERTGQAGPGHPDSARSTGLCRDRDATQASTSCFGMHCGCLLLSVISKSFRAVCMLPAVLVFVGAGVVRSLQQ